MSINKKFLKSKPVCKVTFKVPKLQANGAETVQVLGDFNSWSPDSKPMRSLKNGSFTTTLDLEQGNEYQFRYLIDGKIWDNEVDADKQVPSPFADAQNSVLVV
ncbi:MAG: isoamylase early set domain-containing protein [Bacteroidota bacterium]